MVISATFVSRIMLYTSERAVAGYRHLTGLRFGKRYLVSASLVDCKQASTSEIVCLTNIDIHGESL